MSSRTTRDDGDDPDERGRRAIAELAGREDFVGRFCDIMLDENDWGEDYS